MTHTSGKFEFVKSPKPESGAYNFAIVAQIDNTPQIIGETYGRTDVDCWPDSEANAKLFAAAPELLDACKQLCLQVEHGMLMKTKSYYLCLNAVKSATE